MICVKDATSAACRMPDPRRRSSECRYAPSPPHWDRGFRPERLAASLPLPFWQEAVTADGGEGFADAARVTSFGDVPRVPKEAAGCRKTGERRFDCDGQEAAQRAQQHDRGRNLLPGDSANLNTVAGKPGAVQSIRFSVIHASQCV